MSDWIDSERLPRDRAARSFLLPGEIASLSGSSSVFRVSEVEEELAHRCREGDIHPSGPMCGEGGHGTRGRVRIQCGGAYATSLLREAVSATVPEAETD